MNTPARESHAQISPDGRWLAYQAGDATGLRPEIYVRPSAGGAAKYQVSTNGGSFPRWRGDGPELFYLEGRGGGPTTGNLMAVDIGPSQASFERGAPCPLFDSLYLNFLHPPGSTYHAYAVSRDGRRFLIPRVPSASADDMAGAPVAVVLNWASALQHR